ncbi:MAG: 5-methylcytosine restriction system specificity protein McrC, partial [Bradymonadaceae bacterium]
MRQRLEASPARLQPLIHKGGSKLPLLVRYNPKIRADSQKKRPFPFIAAAPFKTTKPAKNQPYILADFVTGTLYLVLYDWSTASFSIDALEALGFDSECIHLNLQHLANAPGNILRWTTRRTAESLEISTEPDQEGMEQRVGRFATANGRGVPWFMDTKTLFAGALQVLVLPRLTGSEFTGSIPAEYQGDWLLPLRGEDEADGSQTWAHGRGAQLLRRTILRRGSPLALQRMVELSTGVDLLWSERTMRCGHDTEPSSLMWLPIVQRLEEAAEAQRRHYEREQRVFPAPRGTIEFSRFAQHLAVGRPDRVPVRRFELSFDTPESRLFRGVAASLRRKLTGGSELHRTLRHRLQHLEALLHRAREVEPTLTLVAEIDRTCNLGEPQEQAVRVCRDLLEGRYPSFELGGQSFTELQAFEVSISQLFEEAVRTILREMLGSGFKVENPGDPPPHDLSWRDTGHVKALSRSKDRPPVLLPDLMISRCTKPVLVGDVKYKRYRKPGFENPTHAPLLREDLHQICAYLLAWSSVRTGLMVLPMPPEEAVNTPTKHATMHISTLQVGDAREVGVFLLDVTKWERRHAMREPLAEWMDERILA